MRATTFRQPLPNTLALPAAVPICQVSASAGGGGGNIATLATEIGRANESTPVATHLGDIATIASGVGGGGGR
ncbi:hypothetical protein PJN38_30165, partial [Mycobacterium kansasii]